MKKPLVSLPDPITEEYIVRQMKLCAHASFHTAKSEDAQEQVSHPKMRYESFPLIMFIVDKAKEHALAGEVPPYLFARPEELEAHGLFLRIEGSVEGTAAVGDHLTEVSFRVRKIELKKTPSMGNRQTFFIE